MTGADLVTCLRAGSAIADLIAGQVQAVFIPAPAGSSTFVAGATRLGVLRKPLRGLPDFHCGEHVPG